MPAVSMLRPVLLAAFLILSACGADDSVTYEARGRVVAVMPEMNTLRILHEDIPGWMPSMVMDFIPRDLTTLDQVRAGDLIAFEVHVAPDNSYAISEVETLPVGTALQLDEPQPEPLPFDSTQVDSLGLPADSSLVLEDSSAVQ